MAETPAPRHVTVRAGRLVTAALATVLLGGCGSAPAASPTPQSVDALISAGLQAQTSGNVDQATSDYQQVLALDPGNKYAHYDLGVIDETAGRNTDAEKQYRQALLTDPDFVPALFNLAILRTPVDVWEAIDLYRHIVSLQPSNARAHLNLGFALKAAGLTDEGNTEISKALAIDPTLGGKPASPGGSTPAP